MELNFENLLGKTLLEISVNDDKSSILFTTDEGQVIEMTHYQDCCESVYVDEIVGDLSDLIGSPLLRAEESTNSDEPKSDEYCDSFTWTFYKLATKNGYVDIKWYGTSNGYYSESVSTSVVRTLSHEELLKLQESVKNSQNELMEQSRAEFKSLETSAKKTTRFKF